MMFSHKCVKSVSRCLESPLAWGLTLYQLELVETRKQVTQVSARYDLVFLLLYSLKE